jgi:pilus assembly protein CpaF
MDGNKVIDVWETARKIVGRVDEELTRADYWRTDGKFQPVMRRLVTEMTRELGPELGGGDANTVYQTVYDLVARLGWYGPLHMAMTSENVADIRINSPSRPFIFICDDKPNKQKSPWPVSSEWMRFVVGSFRRRRGLTSPLPSRYTGAIADPPLRFSWVSSALSVGGDTLYIRKFRRYPLTLRDQVESGVLNREAADFLNMAVKAKVNLLISGASGAGKTTLATTLCLSIPKTERVVTVEDEHEIYLEETLDDYMALELTSEEPETTMSELLRNVGLKVAPDRVIVGEVRGKEAADLMQAMNMGVDGSMATIHANSPAEALVKWADYVMMSDNPPPLEVIYNRIAAQRPLVVQIGRLPSGKRIVTGISECLSANKTTFETQLLFQAENGQISRTRTPYSDYLSRRLAPIKQMLEVRRSRISELPTEMSR